MADSLYEKFLRDHQDALEDVEVTLTLGSSESDLVPDSAAGVPMCGSEVVFQNVTIDATKPIHVVDPGRLLIHFDGETGHGELLELDDGG